MKRLIAVIATSFFAAGVSAHDIYGGVGMENGDLYDEHAPTEHMVAIQPSVGDEFDRYHGWADGNPDLFKSDRTGLSDAGDAPDVYMGFGGNGDIQF
jgi:hypothetical protein